MSGEISGSTLLKRCEWDETEMNVLRKQVCMLQVMIGCRGKGYGADKATKAARRRREWCVVCCATLSGSEDKRARGPRATTWHRGRSRKSPNVRDADACFLAAPR